MTTRKRRRPNSLDSSPDSSPDSSDDSSDSSMDSNDSLLGILDDLLATPNDTDYEKRPGRLSTILRAIANDEEARGTHLIKTALGKLKETKGYGLAYTLFRFIPYSVSDDVLGDEKEFYIEWVVDDVYDVFFQKNLVPGLPDADLDDAVMGWLRNAKTRLMSLIVSRQKVGEYLKVLYTSMDEQERNDEKEKLEWGLLVTFVQWIDDMGLYQGIMNIWMESSKDNPNISASSSFSKMMAELYPEIKPDWAQAINNDVTTRLFGSLMREDGFAEKLVVPLAWNNPKESKQNLKIALRPRVSTRRAAAATAGAAPAATDDVEGVWHILGSSRLFSVKELANMWIRNQVTKNTIVRKNDESTWKTIEKRNDLKKKLMTMVTKLKKEKEKKKSQRSRRRRPLPRLRM